MEKFLKYFMLVLLVSAVFFAGCSKDDDDDTPLPAPTETAFDLMKDYLIANNLDLDVVIDGWITTADAINGKGFDDYYFIDIRSAEAYTTSHIPGAVNATLAGILDAAVEAPEGKTIIVACYTGQTAGHAVTALRLSGYPNAKVLKWGMAGWHSTLTAKWADNIGDAAADYPTSWVAPPGDITPTATFEAPSFESTSTEGATILAERVAVLLEGFNGVANADVLGSPSSYFINNFWAVEDVEHYGHILGAYRIKPILLADDSYLGLDPNMTVVSYCWTGQTSSMLTAYLKVLGYDSKSLKFGTNGMIYSTLETHKYTEPATDYALEP